MKYLRQEADNPRNVWKRRTVKRVGLPIVRLEDFYCQGHESDEDRLAHLFKLYEEMINRKNNQ